MNENKNVIVIFFNFDVFEKKFKKIFDVFNEKQTTKRIIQYIIQKTSVFDYVVKFQKYFNLTKWNDVILIIMFRWKFKNNVKNEFMRDECKINDLKILMKTTIDFDDRLYERIMKRKYSKRHSKKIENYINNRIYENKINSTRNNREYDHSKTIFMKLNLMMFRKLRQKKNKKNAYYSCNKKNHFAKNCKSKNVIRRQFNVTLKKNSKHKKKMKKYRLRNNRNFINWFWKRKISQNRRITKFSKRFEWKKNKAAIRRLRKSTQQLTISISTNLCFNDSKHFIQIQRKKLKSIKIKIIKRMRKW